MKNSINIFCVIILAVGIFSCKKDNNDDLHDHDNVKKTNTFLEIKHKVGDKSLELNTNYETSDGITYQLSRINYYLTNIMLMDHAKKRSSDDYKGNVLVVVPEEKYSLGKISMAHVHGFKMNIGVVEGLNHEDPTKYTESDPLAIQNPSMHWGWTSGYRFFVMEGSFDSDGDKVVDKNINFHIGLDEMLRSYEGEVHTDLKVGEDFTIKINADYGKIFEGLNLLEENNTVTMDNKELAAKIADNSSKIFTITH